MPANGQWQLIDDFEQWENGDYFFEAEDIGWHVVSADPDASREFWMAWVNTFYAPYLWSYSLQSWIYMEEPVLEAQGAWGYIYK